MIISHKHRYVFIALPRTGSNAIAKELMEHYDGEKILNHHALYRDFIRQASDEEKNYRIIIGVRNPIDSVISSYFKYKSGHHDIYEKPYLRKVGRLRGHVRYWTDTRRYRWVKKTDASFEDYFLRYYHLPYADWSMLDRDRFDHVIRFESIAADFDRTLRALDIEPVRPLPVRNKTRVSDDRDPVKLFLSDKAIARAKRVFGPFMKIWGYEFPREWQDDESALGNAMFPVVTAAYTFYWKHLR